MPGAYLLRTPRGFVPVAADVSAPCGIGATRRWRSIDWSAAFPAETRDRASVLWLWRVAAGFLSRRNIRVKPLPNWLFSLRFP